MKEEDNSRLVEVFSGSRWEAELIKGPVSYTHLDVYKRQN